MCLCVGYLYHTEYILCVYLMRGEYDDRLVWPFHGNITVQMVNQSSDQNHKVFTCISSCRRVTSGERDESESVGYIFTLVDSMYVKGDCVNFRVTKVSVTS